MAMCCSHSHCLSSHNHTPSFNIHYVHLFSFVLSTCLFFSAHHISLSPNSISISAVFHCPAYSIPLDDLESVPAATCTATCIQLSRIHIGEDNQVSGMYAHYSIGLQEVHVGCPTRSVIDESIYAVCADELQVGSRCIGDGEDEGNGRGVEGAVGHRETGGEWRDTGYNMMTDIQGEVGSNQTTEIG